MSVDGWECQGTGAVASLVRLLFLVRLQPKIAVEAVGATSERSVMAAQTSDDTMQHSTQWHVTAFRAAPSWYVLRTTTTVALGVSSYFFPCKKKAKDSVSRA